LDANLERELALDLTIPQVFDVGESVIKRRAQTYSALDPFPGIPAALLNSADLLDYVAATGMLHPFRIDMTDLDKTLKPATYGVPLLGKYVFWEEERVRDAAHATATGVRYVRKSGKLRRGRQFTLRPNTITYVTLEPYFRLPRYIGARFNLNIRDVYRGLLVGTGPLVDPGFDGRLSVPLHNLTSNEYTLEGDEPLVWMEFTKLSFVSSGGWREAAPPEEPRRQGFYVPFPARKKQLALEDYLRKAHPGPIMSSIPEAIGQAEHAAVEAAKNAKLASENAIESRSAIRRIGVGGLIAAGLAIAAILVPTWSLVDGVSNRANDTSSEVKQLQAQLEAQRQLDAERQSAAIAKLRAVEDAKISQLKLVLKNHHLLSP
jgi:deoxycytidine triphosphate deaminase